VQTLQATQKQVGEAIPNRKPQNVVRTTKHGNAGLVWHLVKKIFSNKTGVLICNYKK